MIDAVDNGRIDVLSRRRRDDDFARTSLEVTGGLLLRCEKARALHDQIDTELFARQLYTADQPDPDLLIRTSGELRVSNFLLWQIAYAEIWVTETRWPDFRRLHLFQALADFQRRERRYGGLGREADPAAVVRS